MNDYPQMDAATADSGLGAISAGGTGSAQHTLVRQKEGKTIMKSARRDFIQKLRKLAETAEELKSGKQNYFFINRLVSIKSLCKDPQTAAGFVCFLAERSLEKAQSRTTRPSSLTEDEWQGCKLLMSEAVEAMRRHLQQPTEETHAALRRLSAGMNALQPYGGERVRGTAVRTIRCWDALIVEEALDCILTPDAAPELAYRAARSYTEKYHPNYGAGLVLESVPMLEDIVEFWSFHGLGDDDNGFDVAAAAAAPRKKSGAARAEVSKPRKSESGAPTKEKGRPSFPQRHPLVAEWVRERGWIEIGRAESSNSLIRVLDKGGLIWEGKSTYRSLDDALADAERAIGAWLQENH